MTIATDRGFKIGALYRVINDNNSPFYKKDMVVKFVDDDKSSTPWFTYDSGPYKEMIDRFAIVLNDLEPVESVESTNACSNKSLLLLYINQQYPDDKVLKALVESL